MEATSAGTSGRTARPALRRAVVCAVDEALRAQIDQAAAEAGFAVAAVVDRGIELLPAVVDVDPDVVVLDLSLVGIIGTRLFRMIRMLSARAAIVVLSPFETIDLTVLDAGARAAVPVDDIRGLREVLRALSAAERPS